MWTVSAYWKRTDKSSVGPHGVVYTDLTHDSPDRARFVTKEGATKQEAEWLALEYVEGQGATSATFERSV